ncbi:hypothetical protein [Nesterenkonia sp.]|uniref:hypothetical protein n=1 Tax=Nesterenkonia sp. TaxID=704201 RepID=UPI0026038749|nr:hypothetical protein [Nesterenkonia sp.]
MRFFTSRIKEKDGSLRGFALHAVDDDQDEVYTYVRELGTWNLDRETASDFYFPELMDTVIVVFSEVSAEEARELRSQAPIMDLSDDAGRRLISQSRAQLEIPGQTRTSEEIGL